MKKTLFFSLCFICATTIANAQAKQKDKLSDRKEKPDIYKTDVAQKVCTISGTFTISKSVGSLGSTSEFMNYVRARAMLNSYKIVNGQPTDRKEISITSMQIDNTTRANLPNYTFTYQIKANIPYDQSINVELYKVDWSMPSGQCLFLSKTDPNEYASFSGSDKIYTGFDFKGSASVHPH